MRRILPLLLVLMALGITAQSQTVKKPRKNTKHFTASSVSALVARLAYLWAGQILDYEAMPMKVDDDDIADSVAHEIRREMDELAAFDLRTDGDRRLMDMLDTALSYAEHHRFARYSVIVIQDTHRLQDAAAAMKASSQSLDRSLHTENPTPTATLLPGEPLSGLGPPRARPPKLTISAVECATTIKTSLAMHVPIKESACRYDKVAVDAETSAVEAYGKSWISAVTFGSQP
jgi:hypothetical protein